MTPPSIFYHVRESYKMALHRRYKSEKKIVAELRMPRVLRNLVLEYSRINNNFVRDYSNTFTSFPKSIEGFPVNSINFSSAIYDENFDGITINFNNANFPWKMNGSPIVPPVWNIKLCDLFETIVTMNVSKIVSTWMRAYKRPLTCGCDLNDHIPGVANGVMQFIVWP